MKYRLNSNKKLNLKTNLKIFWDQKEKKIKRKSNDSIEFKGVNFSVKNEDSNKKKIISLIFLVIISYTIYEMYSYLQVKKEEDRMINQQILEYTKQTLEKQKIRNQQENYNNYKYFKINYENTGGNYSYESRYNINIILNGISKITSKSEDSNYHIETIINISSDGNMSYKIYKVKENDEYDTQFIETLEELKKLKFRNDKKDTNYKISIHNNNYDLK